MYQKILVATDLTEHGRATVHKAWELANQADAKLYLVHVVEPVVAYGLTGMAQRQSPNIDHAKLALEKVAEEISVPKEQQFTMVGSVKAEILDKANELEVDLIVVGSHSLHGISSILGSNANAILHGAKCDVMTVRTKR